MIIAHEVSAGAPREWAARLPDMATTPLRVNASSMQGVKQVIGMENMKTMTRHIGLPAVVTVILGTGLLPTPTTAQDWPSWHGPSDTGMGRGDAPLRWSDSEGVTWRTAIPGRGHSSPVVWGDQIFITTAVPVESERARAQETTAPPAGRTSNRRGGGHPTGAGRPGRRPRGGASWHGGSGPQSAHRFVLLSIDRTTGDVLWERTAVEATPHEGFHPQYGSFASNSPVTDGERVYASFGRRTWAG